jgi:transcriptional regulator with GAF, ATPase, and Fis domain
LICAETNSLNRSANDKTVKPLFGDAASVTALEYTENANHKFHFSFGVDGKGYQSVWAQYGGTRYPVTCEALQEKEIERVGGTGSKKVDVRVVAATNRDLEKEVQEGRFREDLFYRLNVIPLHLPPLRERGGDVAVLANFFLEGFCKKAGRKTIVFDAKTRAVLEHYSWPGNVRELENIMERFSILVDGNTVTPEDLPQKILDSAGDLDVLSAYTESQILADGANVVGASGAAETSPQGFVWPTLADLQKHQLNLRDFLDFIEDKLLKEALDVADGVKNQAAEVLGIKRTTLIEKLKKRNME